MELCSPLPPSSSSRVSPVRAERDRGTSTRPASADSSRWRSPGVLIWIFDSGRCLATRRAAIRCSRSGAGRRASEETVRHFYQLRRKCSLASFIVGAPPLVVMPRLGLM